MIKYLLFFIILINTLLFIKYYAITLRGQIINKKIFDLIYTMKYTKISKDNIPNILKDKIEIINVKNNKYVKNNKKQFIKNIINNIKNKELFNTDVNNLTIVDFLDTKLKYSFGPHTDIEWNAIENNGYQVWYLLKNNDIDNHGNMFILYNDYLFNKYKKLNIYYYLKFNNNKIYVYKNCRLNHKNIILEELTLENFKKNTRLFYLDFKENDCLIFHKNLCHMSDIRGNSRKAINFRVIVDKIKFRKNYNKIFSCGFLKNIPIKI